MSPNRDAQHSGVWTAQSKRKGSGTELERPAGEGESPVGETFNVRCRIRSTTGHVKPCGKERGPPRKAKYLLVTDRA